MKSKILFKIIDSFSGEDVLSRYLFYLESFKWSKEQINEFQILRLNQLLKHACINVPYYRKKYGALIIKDLSELKTLDIITRDDIRSHETDMLDTGRSKSDLIKSSSSGTTGIPINYYDDKFSISSGKGARYALQNLAGMKFGQRTVHVWGNQMSITQWSKPGSRLKNILIQQKNIPSFLINEPDQIDRICDEIIKYDPEVLDGYTSSIYTLAKYFQDKKLKVKNLRNIITTAENLEDYQKATIEKAFGKVSDLYGCGEVLGIAMKPSFEDKYFILDPHVILEVQKTNIEGLKEILVTNLDNYAMPMVRYKVGDLIDDIYAPVQNSKYPFNWFEKINGRSSDTINLPNGKKLHPVNILGGTLFRRFESITRHKVIWDGRSLEFVFESNNSLNLEELKRELDNLLKPFGAEFTITITEKLLPSKSGKFRYVEFSGEANKD